MLKIVEIPLDASGDRPDGRVDDWSVDYNGLEDHVRLGAEVVVDVLASLDLPVVCAEAGLLVEGQRRWAGGHPGLTTQKAGVELGAVGRVSQPVVVAESKPGHGNRIGRAGELQCKKFTRGFKRGN